MVHSPSVSSTSSVSFSYVFQNISSSPSLSGSASWSSLPVGYHPGRASNGGDTARGQLKQMNVLSVPIPSASRERRISKMFSDCTGPPPVPPVSLSHEDDEDAEEENDEKATDGQPPLSIPSSASSFFVPSSASCLPSSPLHVRLSQLPPPSPHACASSSSSSSSPDRHLSARGEVVIMINRRRKGVGEMLFIIITLLIFCKVSFLRHHCHDTERV